MAIFIKRFNTLDEHQQFINSSDFMTPNVCSIVGVAKPYYYSNVILTSTSNPDAMAFCYNQGWSSSSEKMTQAEAAKVTDITGVFSGSSITNFDELQYFTGLTEIPNNAFQGCSNLTSIVLPPVTKIGNYAFEGCSNLTTLDIPDSVSVIGGYAFNGCSNLANVKLGEGLTEIGHASFYNCPSLPVEDGLRYADTLLVEVVDREKETYNIKEGTERIENFVFSGCTSLTSLVIPDSVFSIGRYLCSDCTNLTSVTVGNKLIDLKAATFSGCTSLHTVTLPDTVEKIGGSAFRECKALETIELPATLYYIGNSAFTNCTSLKDIVCHAETAPEIQNRTFANVMKNGVLHYPSGSNYDSWLSTSSYYLGKYGWTGQEIE